MLKEENSFETTIEKIFVYFAMEIEKNWIIIINVDKKKC